MSICAAPSICTACDGLLRTFAWALRFAAAVWWPRLNALMDVWFLFEIFSGVSASTNNYLYVADFCTFTFSFVILRDSKLGKTASR